MTERSLQVTYREGRAFAAYLHLSHATGEKSAHCRLVRWLADRRLRVRGRAFGIEITPTQAVSLERLNALLAELGEGPLADHEYEPLRAA